MTRLWCYNTIDSFMNLVCRQFVVGMALFFGVAAAVRAGQASEFERRKAPPKQVAPINFTEPTAAAAGTNAPGRLPTPKASPGDLDTAVRKPFELFGADDSMGGVYASPVRRPPPVIKSKQAKMAEERRKNWAFSTPEEIYGLPTAEEMLDLPQFTREGELKKPMTTFERYLERMEKSRAPGATNQAGADALPSWLRQGEGDDKTTFGADEREPEGRAAESKSLLSTTGNEPKRTGAFDYVKPLGDPNSTITGNLGDGSFNFSGGEFSEPVVRDTARDLRMQEFKQKMLDPRASSPSTWNVSAPTPLASPATVTPFSSVISGSPYAARPAAPPLALPVSTPLASSPGYFSPTLTPAPVASTPAPYKVPTTSFELPKRKY